MLKVIRKKEKKKKKKTKKTQNCPLKTTDPADKHKKEGMFRGIVRQTQN